MCPRESVTHTVILRPNFIRKATRCATFFHFFQHSDPHMETRHGACVNGSQGMNANIFKSKFQTITPNSFSSLHRCIERHHTYEHEHKHISNSSRRKTPKLNNTFSHFKVNAGEIGDSSAIPFLISQCPTKDSLLCGKLYFPFRQAQIDLFCVVCALCLTWQRLVADRFTLHRHGIIFLSANKHIWALKLKTNQTKRSGCAASKP